MRVRRILHLLAVTLAITCLLGTTMTAQQAKGKSHTLEGKVEGVQTDRLTVNHGKVEGYMDAMTMPFKVKNTNELTGVVAGDQINFNLLVTPEEGWIERIEKTAPAGADLKSWRY